MVAFSEVQIRSETSLIKIFREDMDCDDDVVYRGQSDADWSLTASFDRVIDGSLVARQKSFDEFFEIFRRRYIARYPNTLDTNKLSALAQHYGLFTRLLDWTDKPYIALFFACTSSEPPKRRAIYRLNKTNLKAEIADTDFTFIDAETNENIRLSNQFGLLLSNTSNFPNLEEYLNSRTDITNPILTKYIISKKTGESMKKSLDLMGINFSSLFDGLEYLTKEINAKL